METRLNCYFDPAWSDREKAVICRAQKFGNILMTE